MGIDSYNEIGSVLRQARLEMRLSLREAAGRVHIRAHYLEAMELGHIHKLPGALYAKGFLRAYCTFLGLDREEIVRRFEQVEGGLSKQHLTLPEVFNKEESPTPNMVWGGVSALLVLYVLWVLLFKPTGLELDEGVDAPPPLVQEKVVLPPVSACFHGVNPLYPPCYMARIGAGRVVRGLYPSQSQLKTARPGGELAAQ
jgi:transcriptional regulator with XRE-family HTH domain